MVSSVIDFTQSRLTAPDGSLAFTDLAADPAVFEGPEGNVQVRAAVRGYMRPCSGVEGVHLREPLHAVRVSFLSAQVPAG